MNGMVRPFCSLPLALHVVLDEITERHLDLFECEFLLLHLVQRREDRVEHAHRGVHLVERSLEVELLRDLSGLRERILVLNTRNRMNTSSSNEMRTAAHSTTTVCKVPR